MDTQTQESKKSLIPAYLTAAAAIIAAAMPFTAFINGRYSVEVEREKFLAQVRLSYLDRAMDTNRDLSYREGFLHFLVETVDPSDSLHKWAVEQLKSIIQVQRQRAEIARLNEKLRLTAAELGREQRRRSQDQSATKHREQQLYQKISGLEREKMQAEGNLRSEEAKVGVSSSREERAIRQEYDTLRAQLASLRPTQPAPNEPPSASALYMGDYAMEKQYLRIRIRELENQYPWLEGDSPR